MPADPTHPARPELSVVVPMYNEEDVLPLLVERLRPILTDLDATYEVVAVDDGSKDLTPALLEKFRREWPELRVVRLRANAGHQAAISAGLVAARGDQVVTIDADLQDPPEVIAQMLAVARAEGVDVVYGVRSDRTFRMMSRATVDAINALPDHNRVLRFIVPALGFPSATVDYKREERAAGSSKYPFFKMLRLSLDAVTGFSTSPLRAATMAGGIGAIFAVLLIAYTLIAQARGNTVAGWTTTVIIVAGVGAVQLICLGIMGEYIGRMYEHMQGRPTYFVAYDSLTDTDQRV